MLQVGLKEVLDGDVVRAQGAVGALLVPVLEYRKDHDVLPTHGHARFGQNGVSVPVLDVVVPGVLGLDGIPIVIAAVVILVGIVVVRIVVVFIFLGLLVVALFIVVLLLLLLLLLLLSFGVVVFVIVALLSFGGRILGINGYRRNGHQNYARQGKGRRETGYPHIRMILKVDTTIKGKRNVYVVPLSELLSGRQLTTEMDWLPTCTGTRVSCDAMARHKMCSFGFLLCADFFGPAFSDPDLEKQSKGERPQTNDG